MGEKVRIGEIHANSFHLVKKIVKIGPVDPDNLDQLRKKQINASKIYSPFGRHAEWAESPPKGAWSHEPIKFPIPPKMSQKWLKLETSNFVPWFAM